MMAEELEGGGGGLSAALSELSNQLPQNEKFDKVETNIADHQQILAVATHPSAKAEEKAMEAKNENKMTAEKDIHQSGDDGYQSNIPSEYRKYIPPAASSGGEHEQGNSQPSIVPFGREGETRQNISGGGDDYKKYIPKEHQPYASGNGIPQGEEGTMRMKKTKEEAEVKVHERGGYYEDYRSSSSYGGEQPQQSQQPQQDESWRQYVPPPYRKYLPDYIPSEEKHHIHHHEKHHIHHHEEPHLEHGKEKEEEPNEKEHEEVKKEEKESKAPQHHHDEKKEEKEEKAHHAAHDHHRSEAKEREREKEKDHECKEEKECEHHHQHKLIDSAAVPEQQMMNGNIAVDHSVEANIPENNLPHDNNMNNNNSGGSSSSIWVSIGICSTIVLFGSLLYYLVIKGLSRYRQSKEIKEIIVDDDIGRIPATAMEKTHLLDREIRIYQQILQNEPAMKV